MTVSPCLSPSTNVNIAHPLLPFVVINEGVMPLATIAWGVCPS
jgi:hypothetical protein